MAISFAEARHIIETVANDRAAIFTQDEELLTLDQSVGRIVKNNVESPVSTPTFDSAGHTGYAVLSQQTTPATAQTPLKLRVMGTMLAGDPPLEVDDRVIDGIVPCVEIRVGAPFPTARSTGVSFDGIVPWEHGTVVEEGGGGRLVQINRPPLTAWHKRIKGSDFRQGDIIVKKGTLLAPKHVMALASVGVQQVAVTRPIRVGIIATGSELTSTVMNQQSLQYKIPDANGPFLAAALREMGEEAVYLGALPDSAEVLAGYIRDKVQHENFDLLITTGGVNKQNTPYLANAVNSLGAKTYFHHVSMSPGDSVLFASLPEPDTDAQGMQASRGFYAATAPPPPALSPPRTPAPSRKPQPVLFGLPGSPIGSAVCFRFLVTPYVRALSGMMAETEIMAKVAITPESASYRQAHSVSTAGDLVVEGSAEWDHFKHAILRSSHDGVSVEVCKEMGPAKTSPFASSNCWLHVPRGHVGVGAGDIATIYPFCSPKS